jgi:hypothetical protein
MFKKLISLKLAMVLLISGTLLAKAERAVVVEINSEGFFYLEPCEQILSDTTINDDFEDDSVIVILNRAASRESINRTAWDFSDVGALYVEDISRLSENESFHAQQVWESEREVMEFERSIATADSVAILSVRFEP